MSWANKISRNAAASNETAFMFVQTYNSTLFSKYLPSSELYTSIDHEKDYQHLKHENC